MPRWKNGCPKKLYLVVDNDSGNLIAFSSLRQRKWWIEENPGFYSLQTYAQEG